MAVARCEAPRGACASLRARKSSSSPTTAKVSLRHSSGASVVVREVLLRSCSPVLDDLLSAGGGALQPREIPVDGCSLAELHAFVALVQLGSYEDGHLRLTTARIAEQAPLSMPLVSRFGARGLLHVMQQAINEHPSEENMLAVLSREHSLHWISPHASQVLLRAVREAAGVRSGGGKLGFGDEKRFALLRRTKGVLRALRPLAACHAAVAPSDDDGCGRTHGFSRTSVL